MAKRGTSPGKTPEDHEPEALEKPSRSQKKRDSTALQKLGEDLARQPLAKVKNLPLPQDVLDALAEYHSVSTREAKRRQLQFIGRLMREAKEDGSLDEFIRVWSPNPAD